LWLVFVLVLQMALTLHLCAFLRVALAGARDVDSVVLVQEHTLVNSRRNFSEESGSPEKLQRWGSSFRSAEVALHSGRGHAANPFRYAMVVSINPEQWASAHERLEAQGVPSEVFRGFDGRSPDQLAKALELLKRYNNTDKLHQTLGNFIACMHMSPGTKPHLKAAFAELFRKAVHRSPKNVEDLLRSDHHHCVPKMVAIAAAHVRLWEGLADGQLPKTLAVNRGRAGVDADTDDAWYLVMEDDAALCPGWRERMMNEMPLLPDDADIVKLFFFGHWRKDDVAPNAPDGTTSPFLEARNTMKALDIAKASAYELLKGATWGSVPTAGFYAGTQAYIIKRSGARKLLNAIKGKPFQDVDMTMMSSVKHYVWRRVLVMGAPEPAPKQMSLMQVVPVCNREPPKDWWF